ncbi:MULTISPECIES: gamma-glutamyl-gamma-aminobutyrate hydrolase family protein [unclassified Caballeronia]|uniref:gamma-glutamyl-gamma-aminobutyrate hydrolase family protein n=1 Tax=unclassified Caballeronia TaxID=2646786 RepID=UPI000558A535|nr:MULTISPECIES: gamma-glutamyl-gamma-aminobutyrate hydrolase family protein [unclassified Caballeronia]MCE4546465.1 gamma-glutamyl-gamma-aminobutyrate hydrolase family protein [Caballeronia sp. PC1]MCE4573061.1 gamma-glutamyl-gamma-aminobutyrate hydrolase family protein [Caballeronia sp. CLC5]
MREVVKRRPIVGVVCDRFMADSHDVHGSKHSYLRALISISAVDPVLVPATELMVSTDGYLDILDGLLFPGGASDVDPARYGGLSASQSLIDRDRDHVALHLFQGAARRSMPFLAICRGCQEMNVAFGGTLFEDIRLYGYSEVHLEKADEDIPTRYRYKHDVSLATGGILSRLAGSDHAHVNSLHRQGIAKIAPPLFVEAMSPDGLVEACSLPGNHFALGVQWHPEVLTGTDRVSKALFEALGDSCRHYSHEKKQGSVGGDKE